MHRLRGLLGLLARVTTLTSKVSIFIDVTMGSLAEMCVSFSGTRPGALRSKSQPVKFTLTLSGFVHQSFTGTCCSQMIGCTLTGHG